MAFPILRFKEFQGDWIKKRIGDIGESFIGLTYSPKDITDDESFPIVLRSSNIQEGRLTYDDIVRVKSNIRENIFVKENDILICARNGSKRLIGKNVKIPRSDERMAFGAFMSVYRSPFNEFISQLFGTDKYTQQIQENLGATINQITTKNLNSFSFHFPKNDEQQKIASFLSSVDAKIGSLTERYELLIQYKKGVMQKIFNQEIRFKDGNGRDFQDWKSVQLKDIAFSTTGSSNRVDSSLIGQYTFFDRSEDIRTSDKFLFDCEAVIVGGEGQAFIPKYFVGKFDLHQRAYAIMNFKNSIGKYIYYHIDFYRNYFLSKAVGSTVKSLRLPMFNEMPIRLPDIEEQKKIANFLTQLDKKISSAYSQLELSKQFKQGLLQQMFV